MMVRLLISLQSAAAAAVPIIPIDYDLRKTAASTDTGGIIVTGRRLSQRVEREPLSTEPPLGRAEIGLFGQVKGNIHVESASFGNGTTSNRAMVTFKVPF
ncbi:hypothetical protein [Sphingobium aromaticiconvertens]|uniref:hypothetical protein n=1 Tax=Sphingobium aromaticiconvertens TaxID=365341 RepID=UPI0030158C8A